MNKIVKTLLWTCILLVIFSCAGCKKREEPKPILKVITSSQVGTTIFSNKHYYIVYDNGKKKNTSEFPKSEVVAYAFDPDAEEKNKPYLHSIDISTENGNMLNEIAMNIVYLTEKSKNNSVFSPGELYVIDNKYYFYALIDKFGDSSDNGLFEYIVDDNSFKRIAVFNNSITHVEAYQ